ncbi:hypothetical protein [Lutimonas zeaxanthinifaciens]|uniref:hypothetical protein n=1 Tax=Lutimonas zeaxanthinifaciens TaxID=3060215 RepID=UPI00265D16D2|nr:hypothetical protein [Lutimonas sp. YSD2104]WKK66517.1 hypothetical protein QZH61_02585 [Lutimonas sp. YSD2104]
MLHFFRRIRRDLLANSQFFKYLKYALGEIILVVLGILIALYINNQNEQRKEQEKFNEILAELEEELIWNTQNALLGMKSLIWRDSLNNIVVNDKLTRAQLEEDSSFRFRDLYGGFGFEVEDKVFRRLIENNNGLTKEQKAIGRIMTKLYNTDSIHYTHLLSQDSRDREISIFNSLKRYDWFIDYSLGEPYSKEEIDYYLHDKEYKKNAAEFLRRTMHDYFRWILNWFQKYYKTYNIVYDYLENHNIKHNDSLHFTFNLSEYQHWIGKYKPVEMSYLLKENIPDAEYFSSEIELENNEYVIKYFVKDSLTGKSKIFPLNSTTFVTKGIHESGYRRILYNDLKEVTFLEHNFGILRVKSKKVH